MKYLILVVISFFVLGWLGGSYFTPSQFQGANVSRSRSPVVINGANLFTKGGITNFGIASSTPMADLSIGSEGSSTSTIATEKFCMYAETENGEGYYIYMPADGSAVFATTTDSCF